MSRFLRRSPIYRPGWTTFPSHRKGTLRKVLSVTVAFSLAFLFAWENIYVDQLLCEAQGKRQAVENLRAQVAEARAIIQKEMMLALSEAEASQVGLSTPDVEQVVLLSESYGLFGEQFYASAQLSSFDHIQRRILEFFVSTALARAHKPLKP